MHVQMIHNFLGTGWHPNKAGWIVLGTMAVSPVWDLVFKRTVPPLMFWASVTAAVVAVIAVLTSI